MKNLLKKIACLVLALAVCLISFTVPLYAEESEVDKKVKAFSADFSTLPDGIVDDNDTDTVNYLKERFLFYAYQRFSNWALDSGPLAYYFERPYVNGYMVDDGSSYRLPDTAGVIHHIIDGLEHKPYSDLFRNEYIDANIPKWEIDGEWIHCNAYSGVTDGVTAETFRQANLMYIAGNNESKIANIKNFNLEMDFMFKEADGTTVVDGTDSFAVIFDSATAGNVAYENQIMFDLKPNGQYFLGKPVTWQTPTYNSQFVKEDGTNITLNRTAKYHLSMTHIGNNLQIKITDENGNTVITHSQSVPTVLSGVGGNLAITGSNAGAKYANIVLTRLDDNAQPYDFDNRANGYQFGLTTRDMFNWVHPYWSDWEMQYNAIYLRNPGSQYWSNKWDDSYDWKAYYVPNGESMIEFRGYAPIISFANKLSEKFNVYHDAVNGGVHYYAQAPEFYSHHVESGIDGSYYGGMYFSTSGAQSPAITAYLDKGKYPENLLDQTMSLVPKTADGNNIVTKNFKTQFSVRLPYSNKSAMALSFRSKTAGAMISDNNLGYGDKITLYLTGEGYYLDKGDGDITVTGAPTEWTKWNNEITNDGDATIYAEAVNDNLKVKVVKADGTTILDTNFEIPDGEAGYVYYSAVDTHGLFFSLNCDRLDSNGNVVDWNSTNQEDEHNDCGRTLEYTEGIPATNTTNGSVEYYTCTTCGKIYADEDATEEITIEDTVTHKIADVTGDNEIDIRDLIRMKKMLASVAVADGGSGDLDANGAVNGSDLAELSKMLLTK